MNRRQTWQQAALQTALAAAQTPLPAAALRDAAEQTAGAGRRMNLSTVYRWLHRQVAAGAVVRHGTGYLAADRPGPATCRDCGSQTPLPVGPLRRFLAGVAAETGQVVPLAGVRVVGRCGDCC